MCGRYLMENSLEQLALVYGIGNLDIEYNPTPEIFPSTFVPVVVHEGTRQLKLFKWGFYLNDGKSQIINARCETIAEKPLFKNSFYNRRCIIPANAFFEWKQTPHRKVKYKIWIKDNPIFSMAGIYSMFKGKDNSIFPGFVIITTSSNRAMADIHDRMPVILEPGTEDIWLRNTGDISSVIKLMKPYNNEAMSLSAV